MDRKLFAKNSTEPLAMTKLNLVGHKCVCSINNCASQQIVHIFEISTFLFNTPFH